jgi:hypothetical protein
MTYWTKTGSNTTPRHYHVHQTPSRWKTDRKQTEAKPCQALSSSQTTFLPVMLPMLSCRLWCWIWLSWLPVNRSSEGDTQACCIVIGIALKNSIEGTTPTSWSVVDSHMQRLSPNQGLCRPSRNCRLVSMVILNFAWQTKRKIGISFLNTIAYNLLCGGGFSCSPVCACVSEGESVTVSKLALPGVPWGITIGDTSPWQW